MILRCQPGYETFLEKELRDHGLSTLERGEGWLRSDEPGDAPALRGLCFAHSFLLSPTEVTGDSVNALAGRLIEWFLETAREERFEGPWPLWFDSAAGLEGLGRRTDAVERELLEQLKKRMSRVSKLAEPTPPRKTGKVRGLAVFMADFKRAFVSREWMQCGQRRMADDPLAPSRSYLKVEEAYGVIGHEPEPGEIVADLGAAPGGWSYSAAKRGARVVAIDNGPLKGGALGHTLIEHRREDAFSFQPGAALRFDWLFCDLVEEPHHVLRNVLENWIQHGWCRHFVVNLKFGRVDPVALLREVRGSAILSQWVPTLQVRHLFHDREEFTLVGTLSR